jgi:hypothetical protein
MDFHPPSYRHDPYIERGMNLLLKANYHYLRIEALLGGFICGRRKLADGDNQ